MRGQLTPQLEHSPEVVKLAEKAKLAPTLNFTTDQVKLALFQLDNEKAYYDQYGPKLLKIVNESFNPWFAEMMTQFVNASAEQQLAWFQEDHFSVSYITPIKKSACLNPTNKKTYRPIAVSHTLSGLYERLLKIAEFSANPPKNFYGYIRGRSTAIAVRTLKNIVAAGRSKCGKYLIMLDASGAFEAVLWDKVFPKMSETINPRVIQAIWMTYRFNRYEIRWNGRQSSNYFYARQGTKQGGIVSGEVFCEYMNFLNVRLAQEGGIQFNESLWNSLFYADDVILICQSKAQAQRLLKICQSFEIDGYLSWNSDKTVVLQLTDSRYPEEIVSKSGLFLNGQELDLHEKGKYLGYMVNRKLDDHDMLERLSWKIKLVWTRSQTWSPPWLVRTTEIKVLGLSVRRCISSTCTR